MSGFQVGDDGGRSRRRLPRAGRSMVVAAVRL
jgi:hypothetical protein